MAAAAVAADADIDTELAEATSLIAALQFNHMAGARGSSHCNTELLCATRRRAPRRLCPHIGERVAAAMPSREYRTAVFLALDMPSPPDGPFPAVCFFGAAGPPRGPRDSEKKQM